MSTKKKGAGQPAQELGRIWFEAVAPVAKKYWPGADNGKWEDLAEGDKHFLNDQAAAFVAALEAAKPSAADRPQSSPRKRRAG